MRQHRLQPPITEQERAPTPDPFASSPLDDEDDVEIGGPLRPQVNPPAPPPPLPSIRSVANPNASVQKGYDLDDDTNSQLTGGVSMTTSLDKSSTGIGKSVSGSRRDDEFEESQLFPGSDLF